MIRDTRLKIILIFISIRDHRVKVINILKKEIRDILKVRLIILEIRG